MIKIIHVQNPVAPSDRKKTYELVHTSGLHLDEALLKVFAACDQMVISVNGGIIPAEIWPGVLLRDGDCVVASPTVAGGNLLRTLASVAVLGVAALVTSGFSLTAFGFTIGFTGLSGATAAIVGGAITLGGNLLVSALLGPSTPSTKSETASYDPDGPKSLARSGTVIPKGYGTMRWGGNVISSFPDYDGPDQYINALACFGFGPARSISGIQINGKDIGTYSNVQYYTRLGTNVQTALPNFNQVVNGYPQDTQCLAAEPVIIPGTGENTQGLEIDLQFPEGVFVLTKDGNYIPGIVSWLTEFRLNGGPWTGITVPDKTEDVVTFDAQGNPIASGTWCVQCTDLAPNSGVLYAVDNGPHTPGDPWTGNLPLTIFDPIGGTRTSTRACTGEWQRLDTSLDQVLAINFKTGYSVLTACDTQPLYNRTTIYGLQTGKYDVRITKFGSGRYGDTISPGDNTSPLIGQEIWVHSINEVERLDLSYPNMILVGVRALATNQLNGSSLNVTALVQHGLRTVDEGLMPAALLAYEEDNPACVAADMMLDPLYGGGQFPGVTAANITRYIEEWLAWADLNDELVDDGNGGSIRRHVFNGVFDDESNLWAQVGKVGKMSRAALIPIGRDYGVFVDAPSDPVQMFTMGNIVQDSFQETWLPIDDRANQVEMEFADSTRYYKTDNPLIYMDPELQDAGVPIKNVRIDGRGITIPAQAWHLARFKERSTQFLLRSGTFKCDTDSIASRPGNVIILQHDVSQWGWGGRLLAGSSASALLVDRDDLPFVTGTNYNVIVLHPALQRYSGTITSVTPLVDSATGEPIGTQLGLSSFDNLNRVIRAIVKGIDSPISSSNAGLIVIQPAAGFASSVGDPYALWDTDVLETRAVSSISAQNGSVMLSAPLSQAPQDFSTYFYGPVGTQKLVRITNIRKASEFRSMIDWIDYDPNVYVDATPVIGETSAQNTTNPGVTSLLGSEAFETVGGSSLGFANLSWQLGPDTVGVGIYGLLIGGSSTVPQLLARLTNQPTSWQEQVDPGQAWQYFVVGFDVNNNYAAFSTAPNVIIAFVGAANNLLLGSDFTSGFTFWNANQRVGDSLAYAGDDDGEANYTVGGTAITAAQTLLFQNISPANWEIGFTYMLSAYFKDSCIAPAAPNVGSLIATLAFVDASGNLISQVTGTVALNGVTPNLTRVNTPSAVVPANTAALTVMISIGGSSINVPVGSVLTFSHLLLEASAATQTAPSAWADLDPTGKVLDLFTSGSSTGLRTQGSIVPSFTGSFSYTATATGIVISWTGLVILWPDGMYSYPQDGSVAVIGLTASSTYYAFPYYDILNAVVAFAAPTVPLGSPAYLSAAYDPLAYALSKQDNRAALTSAGMTVTTTAAGGSSSGTSGGVSGGGSGDPTLPSSGTRRFDT